MATRKIARELIRIALLAVAVILISIRHELFELLQADPVFRRIVLGGVSAVVTLILVYAGLKHAGALALHRPIERLAAMRRDDLDQTAITVPVRLPIKIRRTQPTRVVFWAIPAVSAFLLGLVVSFPPPKTDTTLALIGLFLSIVALAVVVRSEPRTVCDITANGISAPVGFLARKTFVPWSDIAACEIIHASENMLDDYFILLDPGGRCRLSARGWLSSVPAADRAMVYHALRARFPGKIKGDTTRSRPMAQAYGPSPLWDAELDG